MADTKITALTAITTVDPAVDVLPIVDVSDTTMAASGTTKKITSNQILGAGGTATLASATISGDLTVDTSTLKVDSANNRVGIGTASPQQNLHVFGTGTQTIAVERDGATIAGRFEFVSGNSTNLVRCVTAKDLVFEQATGTEVYRISSTGVATWSNVGGVAGTAMTLNSTGLGVGVTPTNYGATFRTLAVNATDAGILDLMSNSVSQFRIFGNGLENRLGGITNVPMTFHTNNTERARIDASGNLLVGTTSPLSSVSGSSQIALGGAGLQTTSQAISAATATTICRSGSGGMAVVGGYNGTGQYSAIIIFSYGAGGGVTVVSSQNNTGSTITYALSGVNVQITSSLALTNLTTTCIRTA